MTKKQYFMLLWGLCSILPVLMAIGVINIERTRTIGSTILVTKNIIPTVLVVLFTIVSVIGALLFVGIAFAKKVGIRLFLLDKNIDHGVNFIKSVFFVSVLCVIALLSGIILGFPLGSVLLYYLSVLF